MKRTTLFVTVLLLALPAALCAADLKLAAIFSDHMVLQREKPAPVWGWAEPGEQLVVEFAGLKKTATADVGGKWLVRLDPLPACAEPRTLVVSKTNAKSEISRLKLQDVLVGEVWLGSGQSNMAMLVRNARDFETEQAAAGLPLIRMFREESKAAQSPQADGSGQWAVCSPDTVGTFSATLFFFGRELHRELQVPIGLINSSVGGTPIESWISAEAQAKVPELQTPLAADAKIAAKFDEAQAKANYEKALARWKQQAAKSQAEGQPAPRRPRDPREQRNRRGGVGGLFNGKIAPLIPYAMRGTIWYQGEANSQPGKGSLYQYQLAALVTDWRTRWGEAFPFAWVQLPNFQRPGEDWMLVREGMLKTLRLPKTGMAITVDIGESKNIHPKNKQEVGRRLAQWALGDVYAKNVPATCGPLPVGHEVRGTEMVLSFTHTEGGLQAKDSALKGFFVAGEDQQWKPASARITDDQVIVSSPEVKKPIAVRYAWEPDPICNLYNGAGLPASPFRTDDWAVPVTGERAKR
jgi:sialate O-acetylesterase